MLGVEADSFLPNQQRDRCNFARQCETRHLRPHPFGNQSSVKLLERPGLGGSDDGCSLEDIFELVVMIAVEPAQRDLLLRYFVLSIKGCSFLEGLRRTLKTYSARGTLLYCVHLKSTWIGYIWITLLQTSIRRHFTIGKITVIH